MMISRIQRAVLLALTLLSACAFAADIGVDAYKAKCSACHGAHGAGDTMLGKNMKLRALGSAAVQEQSDEELATIIRRGRNKMPSFDHTLSKEQIDAVVKYIRSLKQ